MFLTDILKPKKTQDEEVIQAVFITNVLSIVFAIIAGLFIIVLVYYFGWSIVPEFVLLAILLYFLTVLINWLGYYGLGRMIFCLIPIYITMFMTVFIKITMPEQSYITFFDSRFLLLVSTILPAIVFDIKEKSKIAFCLASTCVCLMLFDPIHNLLGVGYYDLGFELEFYYYINYVVLIAFFALSISIFVLKYKQSQSSAKLKARNIQLSEQEDKLKTINIALAQANQLIKKQQHELQAYNLLLEDKFKEKNNELIKANEELIKTNSELRQFSFTVSHNVRGPVATLMGLANVIRQSESKAEVLKLAEYIHESASKLDSTLQDLSKIIDIRNDLYKVREKIHISVEWDNALSLIGDTGDAIIDKDFTSSPFIFGIRPMIQSILYNLISNSLKYKYPDRPLVIEAKSYEKQPDKKIIEIKDNGLGIDLTTHKDSLFKLYKRFHHHINGRGLGLYLVKSQMDIMNGTIEVESEPDKGTLFRLTFKVPHDPNRQVFFENDSAQLYYDASINITVIIWKKNVTSMEYRQAFEAVLLTLKNYQTPGWIADLRNQGVISQEDQKWFINNVLRHAFTHGLRKIAAIGFDDPVRVEYYNRMMSITRELGIELRVFDSMEKAMAWMAPIKVNN